MSSGATCSAGRAKNAWERCWEVLGGRGGYGSGLGGDGWGLENQVSLQLKVRSGNN